MLKTIEKFLKTNKISYVISPASDEEVILIDTEVGLSFSVYQLADVGGVCYLTHSPRLRERFFTLEGLAEAYKKMGKLFERLPKRNKPRPFKIISEAPQKYTSRKKKYIK